MLHGADDDKSQAALKAAWLLLLCQIREDPRSLGQIDDQQENRHGRPGGRLRDAGAQVPDGRDQEGGGGDLDHKLNAAGEDGHGLPAHGLQSLTQTKQRSKEGIEGKMDPQAHHRVADDLWVFRSGGQPDDAAAEEVNHGAGITDESVPGNFPRAVIG